MSIKTDIKDQIRDSMERFKTSVKMAGKLEAFRTVYEKTDRIISGHPVKVQMALDTTGSFLDKTPGWTDGSTIYLNASLLEHDLGRLPMNTIVLHTKAVNYHELAHVMYSPRQRDDITKWVINQSTSGSAKNNHLWWYAFNALEDQRIETFFTAKYRPAGRYFEAIALKWLVNNSAYVAEALPLIYGRKFLPDSIRVPTRDAFVVKYNEALASGFESVIDSYLGLVFPGDSLRGQQAIRKYVTLLEQMNALNPFMNHPTPTLPTDDNGGAAGPSSRHDETLIDKGASKSRDQKDAEQHKDEVKPRETKDDTDTGAGHDDSDDDSGSDAGDVDDVDIPGDEGDDEGDGDASVGQGLTKSGSSTTSGDSQDSSEPSGTATGSSQDGSDSSTEAAIDAIYDALDELFGDQEFQKELQDTADSIRKVMAGDEGGAWGENPHYKDSPVSPQAISAARKMTHTMQRLRSELEETHAKRQMAGKLDMRRFVTRKPWETDIFQTWEQGVEDEADIEVVVVIDISYSMYSFMGITSEALWTVKRSMEPLESRVTVLGFSESSFVMYQPHERVGRTDMRLFDARSATDPDAALEEAARLFTNSTRTQKLLVTITDGDWQGSEDRQTAAISAMHELDVVTCLLGIGYAPNNSHGMHIHHHLASITDMPKVTMEIVTEALTKLSQNLA